MPPAPRRRRSLYFRSIVVPIKERTISMAAHRGNAGGSENSDTAISPCPYAPPRRVRPQAHGASNKTIAWFTEELEPLAPMLV